MLTHTCPKPTVLTLHWLRRFFFYLTTDDTGASDILEGVYTQYLANGAAFATRIVKSGMWWGLLASKLLIRSLSLIELLVHKHLLLLPSHATTLGQAGRTVLT